jgi:hypothetical protein
VSEKPKGITCGLLILASAFAALALVLNAPFVFGILRDLREEQQSAITRKNILLGAPKVQHLIPERLRRRRRISPELYFIRSPFS